MARDELFIGVLATDGGLTASFAHILITFLVDSTLSTMYFRVKLVVYTNMSPWMEAPLGDPSFPMFERHVYSDT